MKSLFLILALSTTALFSETIHTVQRGDTLNKIASKYGTTSAKLQNYNGIKNPNILNLGQKIRVPDSPFAVKSSSKGISYTHTVKKGDTLFAIAKKYGISVDAIKAANNGLNPNKIYIGQKIKIASSTTKPASTKTTPPKPVKKSEPTPQPKPQKVEEPEKLQPAPEKEVIPPAPEPEPKPVAKEAVKEVEIAPATAPRKYAKVVITKVVSLADFAKTYNMTVNEVNDLNGWNYDGETPFDVGSEAFIYRN